MGSKIGNLTRREKERGNRRIGQAESQLNIVHNHEYYDVTINTSENSIEENIEIIKSQQDNTIDTRAFSMLYNKLTTTGKIY